MNRISPVVTCSSLVLLLAVTSAQASYQTCAEVYTTAIDGWSSYVYPRPVTSPAMNVINKDQPGFRNSPTATASQSASGSDSGSTFVDPYGPAGPFVANWNMSGSSSAWAYSTAGGNHARASASAVNNANSQTFVYVDPLDNKTKSSTIYNPYSGGGTAHAYAAWKENFVFTSDTLSAGTEVTIHLTLVLHSDAASSAISASASASATVLINGYDIGLSCRNEGPTPNIVVERDLLVTVGSTYEVLSGLDVYASAGVGIISSSMNGTSESWGSVDATNSSYLKVDMLDPRVKLVTESGYKYDSIPSAVPEPSAMALLAAGTSALLMRRKR